MKKYYTSSDQVARGKADVRHMLETVLGIISGVLTSVRLLPQVYKTMKMKETRDFSLLFLMLLFLQAFFLILYGAVKPDVFIFGMNISPLVCSVLLLGLRWKYTPDSYRDERQGNIQERRRGYQTPSLPSKEWGGAGDSFKKPRPQLWYIGRHRL